MSSARRTDRPHEIRPSNSPVRAASRPQTGQENGEPLRQNSTACERSTLALETAPVPLVTVDSRGQIVEANNSLRMLFGYSREELVGSGINLLLPQRYCEAHSSFIATYLKSPSRQSMGMGRRVRGLRKDGREIPLEIDLTPLATSTGLFVLAALQDMSEQEHIREMELLGEMSSLLQHAVDEQEVSDVISVYGERIFPEVLAGVYVLPNSRNVLRLMASWGDFSGAKTVDLPDCWAIRRSQVHIWRPGDPARCAHLSVNEDRRYICIPMMGHGNVIGMASFAGRPDTGGTEWQVLSRSVTDQLGLALANLELRERLRNMAIRDPLTNLFNRRYLEETINREIPRAHRDGTPICVLMLDVDQFKKFNDEHGHQKGDDVLVHVTQCMVNSIRQEDVACRYGGEEFAIIMPGMDLSMGEHRAERIRTAIHECSSPQVSVSIGVAAFPDHGQTWPELLKSSDSALYRAKAAGRNRVVVSDERKTFSTRQPDPLTQQARAHSNE